MKIIKYFLALICSLGFIACSNVSYPNWYFSSNQDEYYLYGFGEAKNLQEAKAVALQDLAYGISLNLESNLEVKKQQLDSIFSSGVSNDIAISVNDIELDSIDFPLIEYSNDLIYIQARLNKERFTNKIKSDINDYATSIRGILNAVKSSNCNTLLPKDRKSLQDLLTKANLKNNLLLSFNEALVQQNLFNNVKTILEMESSADYTAYLETGSNREYELINSALMSEYGKFFNIIAKNPDLLHITNNIIINKNLGEITLNTIIKDCNDNVVFSTNLKANNETLEESIIRLRVQLYKKLLSWTNS